MYDIIDVSGWNEDHLDLGGTRDKALLVDPEGFTWIFKIGNHLLERVTEKLSYELALLAGISHAEVQLATRNGEEGSICKHVISDPQNYTLREFVSLVKDSLGLVSPIEKIDYFEHKARYNKELVIATIDEIHPSLTEWFVKTMLFDFLIVNIDRNEGNWGLIKHKTADFYLFSPLYDSGLSLFIDKDDAYIKEKLELPQNKFRDLVIEKYSRVCVGKTRNTEFKKLINAIVTDHPDILNHFANTIQANWADAHIEEAISEFPNIRTLTDERKAFMSRVLRFNRDYLLAKAGIQDNKQTICHPSEASQLIPLEPSRRFT